MTPPPNVPAFSLPLRGKKLTAAQWAKIERHLDNWKAEVLAAARRHPSRSYKLGVAQTEAFAHLLSDLSTAAPELSAFGGVGPSMTEAAKWARTYTLHELNDALDRYIGRIKDALLYGLRGGMNPTAIASLIYKATQDASINWRMIARTEMARANAVGRLDACAQMGYDRVWVPPHVGSCKRCKQLLEGQVFRIDEIRDATNYGRAAAEWVPAVPLHPQCRHSYLPYDPEVYAEAMGQYARMEAAGLTDEDRLDELFDESGQLKPGVDPSIFDAAKAQRFDPFVEGLAVAVVKVARARAGVAKRRTDVVEDLPVDELRTDLYQRELDPEKVWSMRQRLLDGDALEPVRVSRREDGTLWLVDGQHRAEAHRLAGVAHVRARVREGMTWDAEARACRDAIAKAYGPYTAPLPPAEAPAPIDTLQRVLGPAPEDPTPGPEQLDPLLWDGTRLRDDVAVALDTWWGNVAGDGATSWSRILVPVHGGPVIALVDYDALRAARPEWAQLSDDDLHFALVLALRGAAAHARELAPGLPMQVRLIPNHEDVALPDSWDTSAGAWVGEPPAGAVSKGLDELWPEYRFTVDWSTSRPSPERSHLNDGVNNAAAAAAVLKADTDRDNNGPEIADRLLGSDEYEARHRTSTTGWHVAPAAARDAILEHGLVEAQPNDRWARYGAAVEPAGVYVWTDRARALKWARDMAELVGGAALARNDVWRVDLDGMPIHRDPVLGEQGAMYVSAPSIAPERLALEVTKTPGELDVDVAKMAPRPANVGVEHWITIHPHGDEEKGQPVLVRNGADGTMTVIGGAGGNLNNLRLDPSRQVDRDEKTGRSKGARGGTATEQPVSEEEAERQQAEREQQIAQAREQLDKAKAARDETTAQLHSFVRDQLGIDLDELDPKARRRMLAKVRTSALRTLAYGEVARRDTNDGADRDQLGLDVGERDKPEVDPDLAEAQVESDASAEAEDGVQRTPRPSVAQTADQAKALLDYFGDLRAIGKVAGAHRRVIAGDAKASDANQIDWSVGGEQARDERRQKAVEQQIRTDLARTLQEHGDKQYLKTGGKDQRYRAAFQQGGYDTVDSFAHSVLGHGVMSRAAADLLGVAGAAQLVAHQIQKEAAGLGKTQLDLKKVQAALQDLTDDQEAAVTDRGLARINQAAQRAAEAQTELAASERGESLFTTTMARSVASEKVQEAKRGLGMMIGGLEACSALKVALDRRTGEKIKVGGFGSPAQIKELAAKARVKVNPSDIVRVGAGNYTLSLDPERLEGLVKPDIAPDKELRDRLRQIRTGEDLDQEIEAARSGPGMSDQLDRNQAKGKLALLAAGSHLLGFDPGVGKTHTAIAAAMQRMHDQPGKHRALIVAPTNMLRSWAGTIAAQGSGHTVQVVGQSPTSPDKDTGSTQIKRGQLTGDADFTIVSYESLRSYQQALKDAAGQEGARPHSIVIADELQKAKNENTGNFGGVQTAIDLAREHHGDDASFYGLTGTPVEKDVSDLRSMVQLVRRAKGQHVDDRASYRRKYGKLGQDEHIARGDKIAQFRESLDADLFRLSAQDAGNALAEPDREEHKVALSGAHKADYLQRVKNINSQIADYHQRKAAGELRVGSNGELEKPIAFGGRDALMDALYNRDEDNALTKSVADEIEKSGTFKFKGMPSPGGPAQYAKGDHAGEYEHKHVVFGASETSKALFGQKWNAPGAEREVGGLHKELLDRGIKVFVGHGSMSSAENEANYKAFLAHKGKAVFLTNDKNNAGISLQFGDNKGAFQHGATHMHHFTRPVNNATIQQREARILRKGAAVKVKYHTYNAGTPLEARLQEQLDREARTQDLAANAEQRVAGAETLRHHLAERGVKVPDQPTDATG